MPNAIRARAGRLLREPALHFTIIGVVLFGVHRWVAPEPDAPNEARVIEVDEEILLALRAELEDRAGRPATDSELSGAIQRWIDEEILFRESLSLGLERGDPIIRRRLVQKMSFLSEDLVAVAAPTEAELTAWLAENRARYRRPERFTLRHVFVRRDGPTQPSDRANALLSQLQLGADADSLGDPFVRGNRFAERARDDLDGVFGAGFGDAVAGLADGAWAGPVPSGYGLHLIFVEARYSPEDPALAEVVEAVRRDWLAAGRATANVEAMQLLRDGYEVRLAPGATGGAEALLEVRR